MTGADVFYFVASICIVTITVFISWLSYSAVKTLNKVDYFLLDVTNFTGGIKTFKNGLKMGLVSLISGLASKLRLKNNSKEVKINDR